MANLGLPNFMVRWLTSFLCERKQRVKIGQHVSEWAQINAGVPQGTLVGPVSFLLHINDLQACVNSVKYVDDSSIWEVCAADAHDSQIQVATNQAADWATRNLMKVNADKTKEMVISFARKRKVLPMVTIGETPIERTGTFMLLGVLLSDNLSWGPHVEYLLNKCAQRLYLLVLLRRAGVKNQDILRIYTSMVRSVLEYACQVWHTSLTKGQADQLESVQRRALRLVYPDLSYREALQVSGMRTLHQRREDICRSFFKDMMRPTHKLHYLLPDTRPARYTLRNKTRYDHLPCKSKRYEKTLVPYGLIHWQ